MFCCAVFPGRALAPRAPVHASRLRRQIPTVRHGQSGRLDMGSSPHGRGRERV
jgi:hypothetical protein